MGRSLSIALLAASLLVLLSLPSAAAAAEPSCAEGPSREGGVIEGTPCDDTIVVPADVARVDGGAGDDTILAAPSTAAEDCSFACHFGVGSQTFEGGPGNDIVFGERGNDTLEGGGGDDWLFGGIGDDKLLGGPGNDRLSGGFGADSIDGESGDDFIRGDGTIDHIFDSGGGVDTLSYATGITPGFGGGVDTEATGFPGGPEGERGVYLDLNGSSLNANNGIAASGGGVDDVEPQVFERIIGTPFSDYIVGTGAAETIYGGGGADVIRGGGGGDHLYGGADGDLLEPGADGSADGQTGNDNCRPDADEQTSCEGEAPEVHPRDTSKVSVGRTEAVGLTQVYAVGGDGGDSITAAYAGDHVELSLSSGSFDQSDSGEGDCDVTDSTHASCPFARLDSILLAGMGGDDSIEASGFPYESSVIAIGGAGDDEISAGPASEDVLVDGPDAGDDTLRAMDGDDALLHNGGEDLLEGGAGNDLFLSVSICDGETIDGGPGRDNSSWARYGGGGVDAHIDTGQVGEPGGVDPSCPGGSLDRMLGIEDLEGSAGPDTFYGDAGPNQLLGHSGADSYFALAGEDSILANSGDSDAAIDCGADLDSAILDIPHPGEYEDPTPVDCERIRQAEPNSFQNATDITPPPTPPPAVPPEQPLPAPPVVRDVKPPRTGIAHRPRRLVTVAPGHPRRVAFRFLADEPARFLCRLDRRPYRPCRSPQVYRVGARRHLFRVSAIDAAGNRDATPARFGFRVRRLHRQERSRHHHPSG